MRTSAWVTILGLAGLAVACGDQPTEVVPDREEGGQMAGRGTIALATASSGDGYSITTDKDDYQPGDVVHLTGAGWDPEDVLDIVLTDEPQTHAPLQWSVTVGADGTFTDHTYTVDEGDLNVTFTLVARSRSSEQSLSMTFTDGNLQSVTLTPGSVSVPQTGSASSTINVAIGGNAQNCTVTLNLLASPALPAGVTTSITPDNAATTNTNFTRTLNFTTNGVTPGSYPFTLRAVRGADCQGNNDVDVPGTLVVFGAATKLAFGTQPSNTGGGSVITPPITVQVLDAGNRLVANSSALVTMAIQNNPGPGTLSGTLSVAAVGGVATFNDLSIDKAANQYTLRATSTGLTQVVSSNFNINVGAAAQLLFTVQPAGANTNQNLGTQPRVGVFDAGGNLRTAGSSSISLAVTPGTGSGTLTCTANTVGSSNGVSIFAGCKINLAGTGYRLRATSTGLTLIDSNPFNITNADASPPTVNCTVPNLTIWYADNVTVPCTASDASGLANAADASFSLSTTVPAGTETSNALTPTRPVCDNLSNCVNVGFTFMVDRKSPVVTCGSADNAWHSADVSIGCTATDGGSSLGNGGDASFNLVTNVLANTEDANASTNSRIVADAVGNTTNAGPVNGNKIDKKAPTVSCGSADGNWHADNVSIPCTASDLGSGLANAADASFNLVTNVAANTENPNASTNPRSVADAVGHIANAGPITGNKVDKKAPEVSCGAADNDWHGGQATIPCTASDGGSGLADAGDASFDLTTNVPDGTEDANASTTSRSVLDDVGNSSTAGPVAGNKVDNKKPVVTCGAADGNWHADNVSIHCTATDNGSGIESADASFDLSTSVAIDNETDNAETDSREVQDKVGNNSTAGPIAGNKVDKKAPQFTCEAAPTAWSANDVTRDCVAVDGGSGLDPASDNTFSLHTTVAANTETATAETGSKELADAVGNKKTAGPLGSNKVDKKNPQVVCGTADGDWHATDVSIACTGSDGGSGLADNGDASFNLVTNVAANTEVANASTNSRNVADVVGHTATAGPVAGNKVDKKAPVVTCGPADGLWHANNVAIGCTAGDGGSGLKVAGDASFNLVTTVAMGDEISNASTNSKSVLDDVGNSSTAGPVAGNKIDRKAPQVACGNADGLWHANDVSIGCTSTDGGSGLANATDAGFNLSTSVLAGNETANASTNSRSVADAVGNSATGGPISGNQVDKKGPTLSLTCPNSPLLLNQPNVVASWVAADGGSGVAAGFTTGSFGVSTNPAGPHTVFAAAGLSHDAVGNTSSASAACGYTVSFGFAGFTTPVDMNNVLNGANSGQAIPLKWTLKDFNGAPVTTLASVNVTAVSLSCAQGSTADLIEEYAAGASGLINKGDGSYQFNWKTPTSYAKSCKTLRLDLGEGTAQNPVYHVAMFEFKK